MVQVWWATVVKWVVKYRKPLIIAACCAFCFIIGRCVSCSSNKAVSSTVVVSEQESPTEALSQKEERYEEIDDSVDALSERLRALRSRIEDVGKN